MPEVDQILKDILSGMKVLEFAFVATEESHLPYNYHGNVTVEHTTMKHF